MACCFQGDLVAVGVLSGNRNFEGRIHPLTRANYLASPPLVIAYAIAGTVLIDFETEPLGKTILQNFLLDLFSGTQVLSDDLQSTWELLLKVVNASVFYLVGISKDGKEVFLRDIWPTRDELQVCALRLKLNIFITKCLHLFLWQFLDSFSQSFGTTCNVL